MKLRILSKNIILGFYILKKIGFILFFKKIIFNNKFSKFFLRRSVLKEYSMKKVETLFNNLEWDSIEKLKVSIIIPNNNGINVGLVNLINSLKTQSHKNIEIISVDSGSTDNSVEIMKKLGVKVIEIDPLDFNHAYSRNLGAEYATGDYLLFTVSDALFLDKNWIRNNLALIKIFGASSLSTPQGFSSEASLYAKVLAVFLSKRFPKFPGLYVTKPNRFLKKFLPGEILSQIYGVDDTNHLVNREVFKKFQFLRHTVEDMDFGKRLFERKTARTFA